MHAAKKDFIPAAGYDFALRFYDPFARLIGADAARRSLLEQVRLQPGQRVLDLGCGTGTLLVLAKSSCPGAEFVGVDPDEKALAIAKAKANKAGVSFDLVKGYADQLPFADGAFDCVLSSLMIHHLDAATQERALREVARVLKPGGVVHVIDFAGPHEGLHGALAAISRLTGKPPIHVARDLPSTLRTAGLVDVRAVEQPRMLFQSVMYYAAARAS